MPRAQALTAATSPASVADDAFQLEPEWQKQVVYFRTTEAPGTIIVSTAERHLYLVQPERTRDPRMASASAATASSGRAW